MDCQRCHTRSAKVHVTRILGDEMTVRDLCEECFKTEAPEEHGLSLAKCEYCGAKATEGGMDLLAIAMGVDKQQSRCFSCAREIDSFAAKELERIYATAAQEEQLAALTNLKKRADEHMLRWVSRKSASE